MRTSKADSSKRLRIGRLDTVGPFAASTSVPTSSPSLSILVHSLVLGFLVLSWPAGCREEEGYPAAPGQLNAREVRVLLFDSREGCRIRVDGPYKLRTSSGRVLPAGNRLPWTEVRGADGLRVGDQAPLEEAVTLEAERPGTIHVAAKRDGRFVPGAQYAGSLVLTARADGSVRVINAVDVESYVAGVVPNEAWPEFRDESLKGQAVAARTYVLYIMSQRADRPFDVRAGEGDQVYHGIRMDKFARRARRAVDATRGVILCWSTPTGDRAFCAYYSAACGGRSQSLADVQPGETTPGPLRGGVGCDYCKIAKSNAYRWGPAEITKAELLARLQGRRQEFAEWTAIDSVIVSRKTEGGRVAEVSILNDEGQGVVMIGEQFRVAVGSRLMRSTDCVVVDAGDRVRFVSGRGFGHGLGLCQWGMEGQARAGKQAGEILRYYYPGSKLVRAY